MKSFFQTRIKAFKFAFAGWRYVFTTQRNAWIHAIITIMVVGLGLWLKLSPFDWAVIVIAIAMVWIAEFINTSLEAIIDLISPQENHHAKVGKDVGAATVLIAAISAVCIGLLVLGPPLWARLVQLIQ